MYKKRGSINLKDIEYFDPYQISLKLKNGTCFSFYGITYKYSYNKFENNLIIYSGGNSDDNYKEKVKVSLRILSYLWGAPLAETNSIFTYNKNSYNLVLTNNKKVDRLNGFNAIINNMKSNREKLFLRIIDMFYVGTKYYYMQLYEEAYINFFKIVEILSKNYYKSFYNLKSKFSNDKLHIFLRLIFMKVP